MLKGGADGEIMKELNTNNKLKIGLSEKQTRVQNQP